MLKKCSCCCTSLFSGHDNFNNSAKISMKLLHKIMGRKCRSNPLMGKIGSMDMEMGRFF